MCSRIINTSGVLNECRYAIPSSGSKSWHSARPRLKRDLLSAGGFYSCAPRGPHAHSLTVLYFKPSNLTNQPSPSRWHQSNNYTQNQTSAMEALRLERAPATPAATTPAPALTSRSQTIVSKTLLEPQQELVLKLNPPYEKKRKLQVQKAKKFFAEN